VKKNIQNLGGHPGPALGVLFSLIRFKMRGAVGEGRAHEGMGVGERKSQFP